MLVFISWSGQRSRLAAEALQAWLRQVVQAADPWISADIEKGTRWNPTIADRLERSKVGIIVLTRDNLESTWIHFEAGALSKTKDAYVCTLLLDISPSDVGHPLGQFQHTIAEKKDLLQLTKTINGALGDSGLHRVAEDVLDEVFETNWSKLEAGLDDARRSESTASPSESRSDRDLLEEVLEILRTQERRAANLEVMEGLKDLRSRALTLERAHTSSPPTGSAAMLAELGRNPQHLLNEWLLQHLVARQAPPAEREGDKEETPADT